MTSTETYAHLEGIFRAGTKAVSETELSETDLTEVLDRLDAVVAGGGKAFVPGTKPDALSYWDFIRSWFQNRGRVSEALNARYDATIRAVTAGMFERSLSGFLIESLDENPDIEFLDACLEDVVLLSCDCDEEPELPFMCVPKGMHVAAFKHLEPVDGLDMPEDIDYLRDRFERFKAILKEDVFTIDKASLLYL